MQFSLGGEFDVQNSRCGRRQRDGNILSVVSYVSLRKSTQRFKRPPSDGEGRWNERWKGILSGDSHYTSLFGWPSFFLESLRIYSISPPLQWWQHGTENEQSYSEKGALNSSPSHAENFSTLVCFTCFRSKCSV